MDRFESHLETGTGSRNCPSSVTYSMKHGELGNPHQTWRLVLLGKSPGNMGDFHRFTAGRPSGGHPRSRSQWGSFGAPKHHGILCVPWQRAAQS